MGGGRWGVRVGVRVDVNEGLSFCENSKKNWGGRGGGGRWGVGVGLRGQSGCERRIEVFVKIKKKWGGRWGGGVWVGLGGSEWM